MESPYNVRQNTWIGKGDPSRSPRSPLAGDAASITKMQLEETYSNSKAEVGPKPPARRSLIYANRHNSVSPTTAKNVLPDDKSVVASHPISVAAKAEGLAKLPASSGADAAFAKAFQPTPLLQSSRASIKNESAAPLQEVTPSMTPRMNSVTQRVASGSSASLRGLSPPSRTVSASAARGSPAGSTYAAKRAALVTATRARSASAATKAAPKGGAAADKGRQQHASLSSSTAPIPSTSAWFNPKYKSGRASAAERSSGAAAAAASTVPASAAAAIAAVAQQLEDVATALGQKREGCIQSPGSSIGVASVDMAPGTAAAAVGCGSEQYRREAARSWAARGAQQSGPNAADEALLDLNASVDMASSQEGGAVWCKGGMDHRPTEVSTDLCHVHGVPRTE